MKFYCAVIILIITIGKVLTKHVNLLIVGGDEAKEGEFPFIVAIHGINGEVECSGVLVREDIVLTTESCYQIRGVKIPIVAGVNALSNNEDPNRQVVHYKTHYGDAKVPLFLLKIEPGFVLTDTVKVIDLTKEIPDEDETLTGILPGWGSNSAEDFTGRASILHKTEEMSILDNQTCSDKFPGRRFPEFIPPYQPERHFCAENINSGPCRGDKGGPFLVGTDKDILFGMFERSELILNSWMEKCAVNGKAGRFIRIRPFITWIKEILENDSTPGPSTTTEEFYSSPETEMPTTEELNPTTTSYSSDTITTDSSTTDQELTTTNSHTTEATTTLENNSTTALSTETMYTSETSPVTSSTENTTEDNKTTSKTIFISLAVFSALTCVANCIFFGVVLFQRYHFKGFICKIFKCFRNDAEDCMTSVM